MITRSWKNARSVIDSCRGLLRRCPSPTTPSTGASGNSALANFTRSSFTTSIVPSPPTRTSTGTASGPRPRDTARYTVFDRGFTDTSSIST
jgi:hypothetical protein